MESGGSPQKRRPAGEPRRVIATTDATQTPRPGSPEGHMTGERESPTMDPLRPETTPEGKGQGCGEGEVWETPKRTARRRRAPQVEDEVNHANPYGALAEGEPTETGDGQSPWWECQRMVDMVNRVMAEMVAHHVKRWGERSVFESDLGGDPVTTDSASVLKRALMRSWREERHARRQASHPQWSTEAPLWGRIAMQRLRFQGARRWYAVAHTADEQRRRMLVLHVPPRGQSEEEAAEHARLQCTYQDGLDDLFDPGRRVKPSLQQHVRDKELKDVLKEGFRPRYKEYPARRHGRNYGGVFEHADLTEEQLQKERGVFNEGPLHYVPWLVTDMNAIYYPDKNKLRLIWDCRKSGLNDCLEDYVIRAATHAL